MKDSDGRVLMTRFSKVWCGFRATAIILVMIFLAGMMGLSAQTTQDGVVEKDKSSSNEIKEIGLFGRSISLKNLGYIGTFLIGIAAVIALIRRRSDITIVIRDSAYVDNLLEDGQSDKLSRVEKVVRSVERNRKAHFVPKVLADAYRLQQNGRIDEARQKWRDLADYAERKDDDLAKRAGVSIGYLLPEGEAVLASQGKDANLKPDDTQAHVYRGLGEYAGEGIVVGAVLRYFNDSKFEKFSMVQEHNVGSDSHGRVDVALLDRNGQLAAIAECKRIGYVGKEWLAQLTEYCRQGDVQFGLFAADMDPSKWTFLRILEDRIIEITRSQFEAGLVESGLS